MFFYQDHDDQPFVLLHNSAGGFVEGDAAELHVLAEPGTRSLFTTTAVTKFNKCEAAETSYDLVNFKVGEEVLLEYLPDEVIPFARSRVERTTRVALHASSRLFASDIISAGRVSYGPGELFAFNLMRSQFELRIDNRLIILDRLVASRAEDVAALQRLWSGYTHSATVAASASSRRGWTAVAVRRPVSWSAGSIAAPYIAYPAIPRPSGRGGNPTFIP